MVHLRQLGPAFLRHVEAYGELAGAALRDTGRVLRVRATLVVSALVQATAFVILAGATAIAAGWSSPYRWWVTATVLGALALGAAICLSRAAAALPRSAHLQALSDEWQKDKDWLGRERRARSAEPGATLTQQGVPDTRAATIRVAARAPTGA